MTTWRETLHDEVYPLYDHEMRAEGIMSYEKEVNFIHIFEFMEKNYGMTLIPVKRKAEVKEPIVEPEDKGAPDD
jgi:hypothetical protein